MKQEKIFEAIQDHINMQADEKAGYPPNCNEGYVAKDGKCVPVEEKSESKKNDNDEEKNGIRKKIHSTRRRKRNELPNRTLVYRDGQDILLQSGRCECFHRPRFGINYRTDSATSSKASQLLQRDSCFISGDV